MLIIFLTAVKAIRLYLIGTTSRFLMFGRRIYSCKKQNKAKKLKLHMLGWQQAQLQQLTLTATRALGHTMNAFADEIAQ